MKKSIEISADTGSARREFTKLSRELSKQQKIGFKLDPGVEKIFNGQAAKEIKNLEREIRGAQISIAGVTSKAFSGKGTNQDRADFMYESKMLKGLLNERSTLTSMGSGGGGQSAGFMSKIFRGSGGGSGMGLSSIAKGGLVGMAIMGGAAIASRLKASYSAGMAANDQYLGLRSLGLGRGDVAGGISTGVGMGFTPSDTRSQISGLVQSTGKYSPEVLKQQQQFGRAFGVSSSVLGSTSASLYKAGGSGANIYKEQSEILASAIAAHLDRGKLSDYLENVSATIDKMSEQTSGVNTTNIANMMSMMSGMGGAMTPGLAASNVTKLDQIMRNPSQKQGAILYSALAKTLNEGGYKGNLPVAMRTIQSTGFAGVDVTAEKFPGLAKSGQLGFYKNIYGSYDPLRMVKNIGGILESMDKKRQGMSGLIGSQYFNGGAPASAELLANLHNPNFSKEGAQKWIDENLKTATAASLDDVIKSQEGITKSVEALNELNKEQIGSKIIPLISKIQESILHIEQMLMPVLEGIEKLAEPSSWLKAILPGGGTVQDAEEAQKLRFMRTSGAGASRNTNDTIEIQENLRRNNSRGQSWDDLDTPSFGGGGSSSLGGNISKILKKHGGNLKFKSPVVKAEYALMKNKMKGDWANWSKDFESKWGFKFTMTDAIGPKDRSKKYKGGAVNSRHPEGEAGDIRTNDLSGAQIDWLLKRIQSDGYKAFEHNKGVNAAHIHAEMTGPKGSGTNKIMPSDIVALQH